ncbi:unnamed protein product [Kuraishia capsulata CBS 1993]|uniref:Urea transport protein n=1 Tax=Kuraishia capsulata CBS 1993 TaxID=1382522 RepID=W6MH09_9ASCO|nr:uncharacterized protein KUCA_T00001173001 [Kuraishia capsulata CBS 1993]CDK25206.1 unnamed protein product [Kuraishia capsulata CBS 1993]
MGCGVLTTYTEIANIAGLHGLLVYTLTGAIPIFMFSFFGPLIRRRCPDGFVLTEWVFLRYGRICGWYLSVFTILTMYLYMVSELTAVQYAIEALTGINATPCLIIECVVTSIYTALGGFKVSFITDTWQAAFVMIIMVVAIIAYATNINIDMTLKHETEHQLLGANKLGWMLVYILFVAILTNDAFMAGFWLRTFAAKTNRDLFIGTGIASFVAFFLCFLVGITGIIAVWTGDLQINDPEGYNAFFILIANMGTWVTVIILIFAVALSTATFDSLQSAMTSTISNDLFRNKISINWIRLIVLIIMVPCIVVAVKAATNVLQIYLIADLVSASIIPVMFLGLWDRMYFLTSWEVMGGGLGALVGVFIFGTVYYGNAKDGGKLLLVWNGIYDSEDWGPFGAFVIAPFGGILIGFAILAIRLAILKVYSKAKGKPFTALDKPAPRAPPSELTEEESVERDIEDTVPKDIDSFENI